jgi:hypothetical protein
MRRQPKSFSTVADEILAEISAEEHVKVAQLEAVRAATPSHDSELAVLMHKMAGELRSEASDVTYADLAAFISARRS